MKTLGYVAFHCFDEPAERYGDAGVTMTGRSMAPDLRNMCLELGQLEDVLSIEIGPNIQILAAFNMPDETIAYRDLTADEQTEWNAIWKDPVARMALDFEEVKRLHECIDETKHSPEMRVEWAEEKRQLAENLQMFSRLITRRN